MNSMVLLYVNSFAVTVLLLVLRNYRQKLKYSCCEEKVFILFIFATLTMLVFETALYYLWGQPGMAIHILLYVMQTVDFCLTVVIAVLWLYYCLFRLYHISDVRLVRRLIAVPVCLYVLLILVTVPIGAAFKITAENQYVRGIAYVTGYVIGYLYIAAALLFIFFNRKALNRGELVPYLLIPAIPVALGIVEAVVDSPLGLVWAATTLVILEIQMLVMNNQTSIDHLTGLNNRMALDGYVRRGIRESHLNGKPLGLIMIDVDEFKKINDAYGHVEGDRALKATADILRECFAGKHFIARYGGDEFTVVIKDCKQEQMDSYLERLETGQEEHNRAHKKPYTIRLSIGASIFEESEITSLHRLYMRVDEMMYKHKNAKKEGPPGDAVPVS